MDCGATLSKYLLFIFNFVFFLSGIAVLTVGSVILANENQDNYFALIGTNLFGVCILLIVVGVLVTIIGFFGCCGAIRESKCMLYTYCGLLCVIFVMEFAGGIAAFVYRDDIKSLASKNLKSSMYDYTKNKDVKNEWDSMQRKLACCGVDNYTDWYTPLKNQTDLNNVVPVSCCYSNCPNQDYIPFGGTVYANGCMQKVVNEIDNYAVIIGGVAIGIAFIQILGIVFACCLASAIKD